MRVVEGTATVGDADAFLDDLGAIGRRHGCAVQAFDATAVVGRDHLASAVDHANRAFDRDENVARDRAVEILLYAAGRRQIERALALGIDEGTGPVAVVVDAAGDAAGDEAAAADEVADLVDPGPALDSTDERAVREFFGITDAELAATDASLADLACERVALLDVEK